MVRSLNWLVNFGHNDIHYTTCTLAYYMIIPGEEPMHTMCHIFGYLHQNYKFSIRYDINVLDLTRYKIEKYDWFVHYETTKEETPYGGPATKGKAVITWGFFDASHASCLVTRRSTSYVILFINRTPIIFFSERQNAFNPVLLDRNLWKVESLLILQLNYATA